MARQAQERFGSVNTHFPFPQKSSIVVVSLILQPSGFRMSVARKIFAMLRWGKSHPARRLDHKTTGPRTLELSDRRVTPRVYVRIPLFVYGRMPSGDPFHEEARTISINGAGGLISMSTRVRPGERLAVTNQGNDQTEQCIVVSVDGGSADAKKIALKFPTPMPQFWRALEIGKSHHA